MNQQPRASTAVPPATGRGLTITRGLLYAVGLVIGGVGAWMLLTSGLSNILAALWWLAGGVIAHDAILAPVTIALALVATPLLPPWLRAPATVGLVVLGTVTVTAIPVLGRFGAHSDNPTLLDRNYVGGWLVLAAIVVVAVAVTGWRRRSAFRANARGGSRRPPI